MQYAEENRLHTQGLTYSPVTGAKGNIEYLLYLSKALSDTGAAITEPDILNVVNTSHEELGINVSFYVKRRKQNGTIKKDSSNGALSDQKVCSLR